MIVKTIYHVDHDAIGVAQNMLDKFNDIKNVINQPSNNFFYDMWQIKEEFKNTIWDEILSSLPFAIGEARIIKLDPGRCYVQHADIDDRYHLNIKGDNSYLVDVESKEIFPMENNGFWYEMDAGKIHSAVNLGVETRYQLVVRKLLNPSVFDNWKKISIYPICDKPRFQFDNQISSWLNRANKSRIISNFAVFDDHVEFYIEMCSAGELEVFDRDKFSIIQST
jgi:hypothetical protein